MNTIQQFLFWISCKCQRKMSTSSPSLVRYFFHLKITGNWTLYEHNYLDKTLHIIYWWRHIIVNKLLYTNNHLQIKSWASMSVFAWAAHMNCSSCSMIKILDSFFAAAKNLAMAASNFKEWDFCHQNTSIFYPNRMVQLRVIFSGRTHSFTTWYGFTIWSLASRSMTGVDDGIQIIHLNHPLGHFKTGWILTFVAMIDDSSFLTKKD